MNNIEVEVRSFITKEQYDKLLGFFTTNAKLVKEDYQETFYFDCSQDLRIQKNDFYSKIWLKKGQLHDDFREELEIKFPKEDFPQLENLFLSLGFKVQIKWLRKRFEFNWQGIIVCLDYTKGYGYIIELEKMCSEAEQENEAGKLKKKLQSLEIDLTPKEEFTAKYNYYKDNWADLIN
ncbi:MAG: CYTH domain-containing protein [Candidatus Parcubacteria bacterium]|nr:CYTH domain-containing protein [Candidatus Parcubacteria bacterium]